MRGEYKKSYSEYDIRAAVAKCFNYASVMRLLGIKPAGGSHSHLVRRIKALEIDTTHFTGQASNKNKPSTRKRTAADILVKREAGRERRPKLHRALQEIGRKYECEGCGNDGMWMGIPLTLHVDHRDGDHTNGCKENLRYLCPNCHNQTPTFCNKTRQ